MYVCVCVRACICVCIICTRFDNKTLFRYNDMLYPGNVVQAWQHGTWGVQCDVDPPGIITWTSEIRWLPEKSLNCPAESLNKQEGEALVASKRGSRRGQGEALLYLALSVVKADSNSVLQLLKDNQGIDLDRVLEFKSCGDASNKREILKHIRRKVGDDILRSSKLRLLHLAAHMGDCMCIQALLDHAATVRVFNSAGLTPMHLAAASGALRAIELLSRSDPKAVDALDSEGRLSVWCCGG